MAADYRHIREFGNRVGLHYSHFRRFASEELLILNGLRVEKS